MDIDFANSRLEKTFNSEKKLRAKFGKLAQRIMSRMLVLSAAMNLSQVPHLPPLRRHQLEGARKGEFAVDLDEHNRLVFRANHEPIPTTEEDGGFDLTRITAITILSVEDYH